MTGKCGEDKVRDALREAIGFENPANDSVFPKSGVGQLTTFNKLFEGLCKCDKSISNLKPDGWYLPKNTNDVAIICETKNSNEDVEDNVEQLEKYIKAVQTKYKKVVGIIYNGSDVAVYKNSERVHTPNKIFPKEYYFNLFAQNYIDKNLIYLLTQKINKNLHYNFGIKNLNHRMIFTACALVAKRYGAMLIKGMSWQLLHNSILNTLQKSYEEARKQNIKLDLIGECFSVIQCNYPEKQQYIDDFIECVEKISDNINSNYWRGEDVMGIFFNEFTRYKGKADLGQVFTPDHITSLMYRITGTSYKDNVLDACCGSGAFLVKAMSNMIQEVGGVNADEECKVIKSDKLFGVEIDKELYALACANMLIHKDGKTNIIKDDTRTEDVCKWIKSKKITKVLMNPPYERNTGCLDIVENVLNNVEDGAICAFILPDTKLKVNNKIALKWLKKHTLLKIIKLPDVFAGMANIMTSIFIFKTGEPQVISTVQNNKTVLTSKRDIFACWIQEDGLETVKNQGRHDINNKWKDLEDYWVDIIYKQSGSETIQWLNPLKYLSYQSSKPDFTIYSKDINKICLNYILFKKNIVADDFEEAVKNYFLYGTDDVLLSTDVIKFLNMDKEQYVIDTHKWKKIKLDAPYFSIGTGGYVEKSILEEGNTPRITVSGKNNGVSAKYKDIDNPNYRLFNNCISYSFLGTCFYHPYPVSLDMKVHCIKPLQTELNQYTGLFLVMILLKTLSTDYIDQISSSDLKDTEIYLPVKLKDNSSGQDEYEPDWQAMENVIKPIYDRIYEMFKNL